MLQGGQLEAAQQQIAALREELSSMRTAVRQERQEAEEQLAEVRWRAGKEADEREKAEAAAAAALGAARLEAQQSRWPLIT